MNGAVIRNFPQLAFALLFSAVIIGCAQASDKSNKASLPQVEFDPTYQQYAKILEKYVIGDRVDYEGLTKSRKKLEPIVAAFASAAPDSVERMTKAEKIAFYINAYNAITLLSIVERYPVKSIKHIDGVWKKRKWNVADEQLSLNDIEHEILRKMGEPRIHFAINCASISCPPLYDAPFSGDSLDSQLGKVTRSALSDTTRAKYTANRKELEVSKIFKWFGEDFESTADQYAPPTGNRFSTRDGAVIAFVAFHLGKSANEQILRDAKKLGHLPYDWDLNDIERGK